MTGKDYFNKVRNDPGFLYVLRRTIPMWCWQETLDEAVACCVEYGIDELCVFIDSGTFTHYYPSEEWLKEYQKVLFAIKKKQEEHGIVYSLNPNVTQGHGDRGRRIDLQHPDWDMCTDAYGVSAVDCACCISDGWREYFKMQWTLYAQTHPAVIWIEDDIRFSGHGPVARGCFCKTHIRRFNEMYGSNLTAAEISEQVNLPGKPSVVRRQWLEFLNLVQEEVIRMLTDTVHAVSPETVVGLMSSGPDLHAGEGRNWDHLYRCMAGKGEQYVASRPPLGNYMECGLDGLYYTFSSPCFTRSAFGEKNSERILEEGEIENFPYTNYSKSNCFMFLQNALSLGAGCHGLTLNLFDHSGTPMMENQDILSALKQMKPFLQALKEKYPDGSEYQGIGLYSGPESAVLKDLGLTHCGSSYYGDGQGPIEILANLGLSFTYNKQSPLMLLAGQSIRNAAEAEIKQIFSRGVMVDAAAFLTLCDMGYEDLLGGKLIEKFPLSSKYPIGGEHFFNESFGGRKGYYFDTAIHTRRPEFCWIQPDPDAQIISSMVDIEQRELCSCCYCFTNKLGGRVVVYPIEFAGVCNGFCTPGRKRLFHHLFKWLAFDRELPLFMAGDRRMLPFRADGRQYSLIGLFNLSLDPLYQVRASARFDRKVQTVNLLDPRGRWEKFDSWQWHEKDHVLTLDLACFDFAHPLYFTVHFSGE